MSYKMNLWEFLWLLLVNKVFYNLLYDTSCIRCWLEAICKGVGVIIHRGCVVIRTYYKSILVVMFILQIEPVGMLLNPYYMIIHIQELENCLPKNMKPYRTKILVKVFAKK